MEIEFWDHTGNPVSSSSTSTSLVWIDALVTLWEQRVFSEWKKARILLIVSRTVFLEWPVMLLS